MDRYEIRVWAKIRKWLKGNTGIYDFWFVYDRWGHAINWEGGFRTTQHRFRKPFRNQYTRIFGRRLIKNWSDLI